MIILDASATAALLLNLPEAPSIRRMVEGHELAAPDHMALEVLSVLRGWARSGQITDLRARAAISDLEDMSLAWFPTQPLLDGVWALRHNASAYDAAYLTLAQELSTQEAEVRVLTCDRRLARAFPDLTGSPENPAR